MDGGGSEEGVDILYLFPSEGEKKKGEKGSVKKIKKYFRSYMLYC
jgi:hypothetical protein